MSFPFTYQSTTLWWGENGTLNVPCPLLGVSGLGFQRVWVPTSFMIHCKVFRLKATVRTWLGCVPGLAQASSLSWQEVALQPHVSRATEGETRASQLPCCSDRLQKTKALPPFLVCFLYNTKSHAIITRNPKHQDVFLLLLLNNRGLQIFLNSGNTIMEERDHLIWFRNCIHKLKC